jgi:hypothetical protein
VVGSVTVMMLILPTPARRRQCRQVGCKAGLPEIRWFQPCRSGSEKHIRLGTRGSPGCDRDERALTVSTPCQQKGSG